MKKLKKIQVFRDITWFSIQRGLVAFENPHRSSWHANCVVFNLLLVFHRRGQKLRNVRQEADLLMLSVFCDSGILEASSRNGIITPVFTDRVHFPSSWLHLLFTRLCRFKNEGAVKGKCTRRRIMRKHFQTPWQSIYGIPQYENIGYLCVFPQWHWWLR
jgi:hypothetical protein